MRPWPAAAADHHHRLCKPMSARRTRQAAQGRDHQGRIRRIHEEPRSTPASSIRRRSATCWSTANSSVTTWSNTSARTQRFPVHQERLGAVLRHPLRQAPIVGATYPAPTRSPWNGPPTPSPHQPCDEGHAHRPGDHPQLVLAARGHHPRAADPAAAPSPSATRCSIWRPPASRSSRSTGRPARKAAAETTGFEVPRAVRPFRRSVWCIRRQADPQIHHMCYSEFNEHHRDIDIRWTPT